MLQYITDNDNERFSIEEQCQMFIEGGGAWIQLSDHGLSDERICELSVELIPLCKETSTILMLENRIELAKELGLHGVHLGRGIEIPPRTVREDLGAEAIIGVEVASPQAILALKGRDIDYVTLAPGMSLDQYAEIIAIATEGGNTMPVVLTGDYHIDDSTKVLATGASGVAVCRCIADADDPVSYTEQFISSLNATRKG